MFFAAPADDPRACRPVDVAMLVASLVVVVLLGWHHRARGDLDARVLRLFAGQLPGWLSGIATVVFVMGGLYVVALIVGIALAGHRLAIARDMLLAIALCFGLVFAAAYLAGPEFPDLVPELWERNGFPSYPVARLAMAVAAIRVAGPYLSLPVRRVGIEIIAAMSIAAVVLSYGTVSATLGGLALGLFASSAVHLVFGSGLGIPSKARIAAALEQIGIGVARSSTSIANAPGRRSRGSARTMTGTCWSRSTDATAPRPRSRLACGERCGTAVLVRRRARRVSSSPSTRA